MTELIGDTLGAGMGATCSCTSDTVSVGDVSPVCVFSVGGVCLNSEGARQGILLCQERTIKITVTDVFNFNIVIFK